MIIVVGGISGPGILKDALRGVPHHIFNLLVQHPELDYDINKEMLARSVKRYNGQLLIGKSYGAWVAAESHTRIPRILLGLPLKERDRMLSFPKTATRPILIYGKKDPYVDKATLEKHEKKYKKVVFLPGDHSLRPHTPRSPIMLKAKLSEVICEQDKKKFEQGNRSALHQLMQGRCTDVLSSFSSTFNEAKKSARVPITKKTTRYRPITAQELALLPAPLRALIDRKQGPITDVVKRGSLLEGEHVFQCSILDTARINPEVKTCTATGGLGVSADKKLALRVAVLEAAERYSTTLAMFDTIRRRYRQIPAHLRIPARELKFYRSKMKGITDGARQIIDWTPINDLETGEEKLYPAQLITPSVLRYRLRETTSTGTAIGQTASDATLAALQESIERNMLMRWFYRTGDVTSSVIPSDELENADKRISKLRKCGFKIEGYRLDWEGINTIFLTLADQRYRVGIGSSCGKTQDELIRKALQECLITYDFAETLKGLTPKSVRDIAGLVQHLLYYQGQRFSMLRKLLNERITKNVARTHPPMELAQTVSRLHAQGYRLYVKEITSPDVRAQGLVVMKVIGFGFLDLVKNHRLSWTGYYACPKQLPKQPTPFA